MAASHGMVTCETCSPCSCSAACFDTTLQREDLRALAVVLLECILSALAFSGPSQLTSAESIQVGGWVCGWLGVWPGRRVAQAGCHGLRALIWMVGRPTCRCGMQCADQCGPHGCFCPNSFLRSPSPCSGCSARSSPGAWTNLGGWRHSTEKKVAQKKVAQGNHAIIHKAIPVMPSGRDAMQPRACQCRPFMRVS